MNPLAYKLPFAILIMAGLIFATNFSSLMMPDYQRVMKIKEELHASLGCDIKGLDTYNKDQNIRLVFDKCSPGSQLNKKGVRDGDVILVNDPSLTQYPILRFMYSGEHVMNVPVTQPAHGQTHIADAYDTYYYNFMLAYQGKEVQLPISRNSNEDKRIITVKVPELSLTREEEALIDMTWNKILHP